MSQPGVDDPHRSATAGNGRSLPHVVVVGGGIAGLAAAFFLRDAPVRVTVLEGSARLGGKLAVSDVAGIAVDEGAESLLARRRDGVTLIEAVGLGPELVTPGTTSSALWTRGALRPLPRRQFLGVPADLDDLTRSGVLSAEGLARARLDCRLPPSRWDGDVAVARYVGARFGHEVVDRLVDPLLGGVYAGRSELLSFEATMGPLAAAARAHRCLTEAAASLLPAAQPQRPSRSSPAPAGQARPAAEGHPERPAFTTLARGLGTLPAAVAKASTATVRTGSVVRELARTPHGWRLVTGSATAPELIEADAVVLAVPARPTARLLAGVPGTAAAVAGLGEIDYASMAIVTLAYPRAAFPTPLPGAGFGAGAAATAGPVGGTLSGYLVPAVDGRAVKAVTFSTVKWPHLLDAREPVDVVRCSLGRIGEERLLQRDDRDLVALAAAELAAATGVRGAPLDARVTRWGGALPQYTVGHLARVARIRDAVAAQPGLAVCGAAYDGVGVPACVATARLAVDRILHHLRDRSRHPAAAADDRQ